MEMRDNYMKQERFVWTEMNFTLEKNGGYMQGSISDMSINVDRQWVSERHKIFATSIQWILVKLFE